MPLFLRKYGKIFKLYTLNLPLTINYNLNRYHLIALSYDSFLYRFAILYIVIA